MQKLFREMNGHNNVMRQAAVVTAELQGRLTTAMDIVEGHKDPLDRYLAYFQQMQAMRAEYDTGIQGLDKAIEAIEARNTVVIDRKTGEKEYDQLLSAMNNIQSLIHASESPYRKEKGPFTADTLYIGGTFQLFNRTITDWRESFDRDYASGFDQRPVLVDGKYPIASARDLTHDVPVREIIWWQANGVVPQSLVDDLRNDTSTLDAFNQKHASPSLKTSNGLVASIKNG